MQHRFTEEQWRVVLSLSEAAADLPPQDRRAFLEASGEPPEVIQQALLLIAEFSSEAETPDRVGSSAGRFVITEYCGSGGVGDVYRANDPELDRTVALKFLRPAALEQSGAVDRFIREARTVSALNHANIVTVYEVLRSGEELAIVMEFVEGTPLRALCGTPLGLKQAITIGRQIALALAAAHQRGIVHRDIKPENAILRPDGSVKVLDFGLATSLSLRRDGDAVSASHLFAGTWRYMSPEQSRGESVTAATDIFSLGLVLYEMLTGRSPVSDPPDLSSSTQSGVSSFSPPPAPGKLPRRLQPLLRLMFSATPSQRPSAASVVDRLAEIEQSLSRKSRVPLILVAALVVLIALAFLAVSLFQNNAFNPLLATVISVEPGDKYALALSPNGDRIAYAWVRDGAPNQIYVQSIDERNGAASPPVRLTQARWSEDLPAWSPDGRQIAMTRQRAASRWDIILHDVLTGHERVLTDFAGRSLIWTTDGKWLLTSSGIYLNHSVVLISAKTGDKYPLTITDSELNDDRPTPTPDHRSAIFARFFSDSMSRLAIVPLHPTSAVPSQVSFLSWPTFQARLVRNPVYSSDGRDLFFIAQVDGIRRLYRSQDGKPPVLLASLGEHTDEFAIAMHRNRLAFTRNLDDTNIWTLQLKRSTSSPAGRMTRIIASSRLDQRPAVSPDGSQIAFESNRSGYPEIWLSNLATGSASQLTALHSLAGSPGWSPDGRWVVFDGRVDHSSSLFRVAIPGGETQRLTTATGFSDQVPAVSPDGRWIYFSSDRSGRFQIWRIPLSGGAATVQTEGDGTAPQLSPDGRFLYYLEKFWAASRLWRKDLLTGQTLLVSDQVMYRGYAVGKDVVYLSRQMGSDLKLLSVTPEGRHARTVAILPSNIVGGMSLNKSEGTLYFSQLDSSGDEIMLVNSF
jgi:eukaryotic-like serine/threonine-protein kinase